MVGNANTLIGMGKEPAEVGFFAESESVLEMEGKRLVDFLLLRIVSLQKTMGGDDISRTDVEAKLMADQGWLTLSFRCPMIVWASRFALIAGCTRRQRRHSNRMAFLFLIIDILVVDRLVVERDILVCYVVFYRHFAMQRAGYDSLFLGFGVRNIKGISRFQPIIYHR